MAAKRTQAIKKKGKTPTQIPQHHGNYKIEPIATFLDQQILKA
jgi:hypothetical protein